VCTVVCNNVCLLPVLFFFLICLEIPQDGSRSAGGAKISGTGSVNKVWLSFVVQPLVYRLSLPSLCSSSNDGSSPKVLRQRLVSATYLNSTRSVLGIVKSSVMFTSLPPVLLHRACLATWCAGQCSM
jgi:hypothetical protein